MEESQLCLGCKGCPWSLSAHGFSRVPFASTPYTIKMNHLHKSFKTTDALAHRYDIKSLRIEKSAKQESFQQDCKGFQLENVCLMMAKCRAKLVLWLYRK